MAPPIRLARSADVDAIQGVELDAGRRFRDAGLAAIADDDPTAAAVVERHIGDGTAWVAVARSDEPFGVALGSIVDGDAHLDELAVTLAAGGRGVGSALLERVAGWAAGRRLRALTLTTFRDVAFNGPFYARRGFRELDEAQLGPELAAIRAAERAAGLDLAPRVAMRRALGLPRRR